MNLKKDDQNEFQKLVSYINEALNEKENLDPLLKIGHVIQSIKDFYKNDKKVWKDREDPNESKEMDHAIYTAYCNENSKRDLPSEDSAEIEIKLIITRCNKKANAGTNDPGSVAGTSTGISNTNLIINDQTLMGNFKTNVKLLKGVFNYLQPLIMCHESIKETIENETGGISEPYTPIQMLYLIVETTRNCLCHLPCFFDPTLIRKMRSNIKNLYDILGVDLNEKKRQKKLETDDDETDNNETDDNETDDNTTDDNFYYYFDEHVDKYVEFAKEIKEPKTESRSTINREIKSLIMRGHSEGEVKDSDSKSIILFGSLLHQLVGTRETNWSNITEYFDGYKFELLKDGGLKRGLKASSAGKKVPGKKGETKNNFNITLKRMNQKDFFFEAIRLKLHWAQMLLRDEGAGGSSIDEIRRALEDGSATQFVNSVISEKKEQLNKIINSIKSTDPSGSADKLFREIISEKKEQLKDIKKKHDLIKPPVKLSQRSRDKVDGIDVFFKELIDCEKFAYISSADGKKKSNDPQQTPTKSEQKLITDFTDSNRIIICPLKIQNQWFLIVADRAANFRSLYNFLDSVSAPEVQKLCDNFVYDLKKLAAPKGEIKNDPLLSNDPQQTPAELKQLNESLIEMKANKRLTANFTADSNGLIICPLKVENRWFLFVVDCANHRLKGKKQNRKSNRCSLYGFVGNYSVNAPDVRKLCKTFLKKLESLEDLKNIPKGKPKKQPQKIDEDCDSLICSLAFNLVYCPLHLYPKDVRRIKWQ